MSQIATDIKSRLQAAQLLCSCLHILLANTSLQRYLLILLTSIQQSQERRLPLQHQAMLIALQCQMNNAHMPCSFQTALQHLQHANVQVVGC